MGGRDGLEIPYDYYDSKGHRTGTVILTQEMYDAEHWALFTDENGNIYYYKNSTGNLYFTYIVDNFNYILLSNKANSWELNTYYKYDKTTDAFDSYVVSKSSFKSDSFIFNPSGLIKTKGMSVFYYDTTVFKAYEYYHYVASIDFPILNNYNNIAIGNYEYIDVKLNDCFSFGLLEDTLSDGKNIKITYKVNKFEIKFYDIESGTSFFSKFYSNVNENHDYLYTDEEQFYYLRFPRDEIVENMIEKGKQYAISLNFDFSVTTNIDDKFYTFTQRYVKEDVYDFTYGTPINPDEPPIEDDPTSTIINSFTNSIGEQTGAINEQTNVIKEQTEVNKNIFQKIGDILSYINPFSENFFVYKLIELLLEMLKSLFIPSDEFFSNYFSDLNEWFSDRFGFLYYPLELFFDLADRFLHINFSEPIIDIPDIYEPTTNNILIHATQFNFNTLLEQNSLQTVHNIYLIIVDAIIYVGLVILLYNKYEEVMTK